MAFAIVFPGQGSQSVGMLQDIANNYPHVVKPVFEEASNTLGFDLWQLVSQGPTSELNKTKYTQPALLAASYAAWKILNLERGIKPVFLAGHSLGEYTALACANVINFTDAMRLVFTRGQYMQEAVPEGVGAMAAIIGLDEAAVQNICLEAVLPNEVLSPANYNSVGQVVIAGHAASVQNAVQLAKSRGAKLTMILPVSVPSHCALMREAAVRLADFWQTIPFNQPDFPVLSNADVKPYTTIETIREGLAKQLYLPVRWVEIIQYFINNNVNKVIECGPGKVLCGLNKRIDKQLEVANTSDLANLTEAITAINAE